MCLVHHVPTAALEHHFFLFSAAQDAREPVSDEHGTEFSCDESLWDQADATLKREARIRWSLGRAPRIHNQNMTTAAKAHAERKTFVHLSWRVATRRQSLRRAKLFSILWRFRYRASSCGMMVLRPFRDGLQGLIPLSSRASRYQSASYPRSARRCSAGGRPSSNARAPM